MSDDDKELLEAARHIARFLPGLVLRSAAEAEAEAVNGERRRIRTLADKLRALRGIAPAAPVTAGNVIAFRPRAVQ